MRNMLTFMIPWAVGLAVGFKVSHFVFVFVMHLRSITGAQFLYFPDNHTARIASTKR
jgi:hypothetical protein